jgi:coproporphyrinogen III oxidase
VFPVVSYQDDRIALYKAIGDVCARHKRLYPDLPESYMRMFQVSEPDMGVGYGAGLALSGQETDQAFYGEAAEAIFKAYFQIVDRRKDMSFNHQQVAEMDVLRSAMTRFVFMDNRFFKGGIQMGVPVESFMLHMLPPVVKF